MKTTILRNPLSNQIRHRGRVRFTAEENVKFSSISAQSDCCCHLARNFHPHKDLYFIFSRQSPVLSGGLNRSKRAAVNRKIELFVRT